ncbi:MAG: TerB N-terminal domain-containing protein [Peptococcaceae bacterium]|nr:TerB N-terminal domain-containing protein [Peptococcaceae bacterium]
MNKKYESLKIPGQPAPRAKANTPASLSENAYYEIEYGSFPVPGVGKFVQKPQKIKPPEKDEVRDVFRQMRDIGQARHPALSYWGFRDPKAQSNHAADFYNQGVFMKDFTDNYTGSAPFSQYFPYYQMLGYDQFRTYFTWRAKVRRGHVADTSVSYAFLYIYELLNNIGADSPQDGLDQLMFFWKAFRAHNKTVDRYVLKWLKDYHIYYELPRSFKEFAEENGLAGHYPRMADAGDNFDLFCDISKYDVRKSGFFAGDRVKLVTDCFYFVTDRLRETFMDNGFRFDDFIFQPTRKMSEWTPFKGAIFYPRIRQADRRVVLSENEIYICSQNHWAFNTTITSEGGKQLVGYVMKQMEAVLRKAVKYKFKLSAHIDAAVHPAVRMLRAAGLSLEDIVSEAAAEFYREATKTVVKVDREALSVIRREALATQEKLIVPEREEGAAPVLAPLDLPLPAAPGMPQSPGVTAQSEPLSPGVTAAPDIPRSPDISAQPGMPAQLRDMPQPPDVTAQSDLTAPPGIPQSPDIQPSPPPAADVWARLKDALDETEIEALAAVLRGAPEIKEFAGERGVMLEVLADGINGKAMDCIGDSLMDEDFALYGDYRDQVKEMVE